MFSLRRALAVRHSVTMFVALLIIGAWVAYGAGTAVRHELDRGLRAALGLEVAALAAGHPIAFQQQWPGTDRFVEDLNRFVVVRDRGGRIVQTNVSAAATLPLDTTAFLEALRGERTWVTLPWSDGEIRTVWEPAPAGTPPGFAVVQVAASLTPVNRTSQRLYWVMLGTVALATFATAIGATGLAHRAVRPVEDLVRQAASLDVSDGDAQLVIQTRIEEYQDLATVLNDMLTRLQGALAGQRRIIDDVAHELRTPLTAIQGTLEVGLRSRTTDTSCRRLLESCLEDVEDLSAINESLLMLARLDAGQITARPRPTDLAALAADRVQRIETRSEDRSLEIVAHVREPISVDPDLVAVALDQILANAVEHTPPGTAVQVTIARDQGVEVVTVDDAGPGLPDDVLPALFDRLYRRDLARPRDHGPGLGLTIAAGIVALQGGTISAEHSSLGGLQIRCTFPAD